MSKIQDAGLSDYEVRDLNDEINKLMREKRHWENQIIALGGANYRRSVAMLDADGKEVPGTKGYKYFGRAKELPGVKELFESKAKEEDEDKATAEFYKKFTNNGPAYYGDLDEADGELLEFEKQAELAEYHEAVEAVREALGLDEDAPLPGFRDADVKAINASKSNANGDGEDAVMEDAEAPNAKKKGKRGKKTDAAKTKPSEKVVTGEGDTKSGESDGITALIPFLTPEMIAPPKMPTREELEVVLLDLRKRALLDEYLGDA